MADKADISAKLEVDGEKAFRDSLKAVDAELKNFKSEMDLTASAMDDMADSEEKTAKQSATLEKIIDTQEKKLGLLNEKYQASAGKLEDLGRALEDAKNEFGANSEQALKAQNAYNNQLKSAMNWKTQINKTATEMNKAKKAFSDLGKASDDLGESLAKASDGGGKIKEIFAGNVLAGGAMALAGAVANIASSFLNIDKATEEVRENLAKVDSAFSASGKSSESARKAYRDFYKILGDSDTAAESTQLLAQLAKSEQEVDKWTRTATGVMATFGDSLPINSLIEAANETAKVGTVTGVLADALNWVGISEDEFNAKLAACSSEQERNTLITETLAATYEDAATAYEANNAGLMQARELQAQLDESLAALGGTVQNVKNGLLADFLPAIVQIIEGFNDFVNGVDGADEALSDGIEQMIKAAAKKAPDFLAAGVEIIGMLLKGIVSNLPALAVEFAKMPIKLLAALLEGIGVLPEGGRKMIDEILDGAEGKLKGFYDLGINAVKGLWSGIKAEFKSIPSKFSNLLSKLVGTAEDELEINSPSKVFYEIGQYVVQGLAEGIKDGEALAANTMDALNQKIIAKEEELTEALKNSDLSEEMKESLNKQLEAVKEFRQEYESAWDEITKKQKSMAEKLADYGDLFTRVTGEAGESLIELSDLSEQINQINLFKAALDRLKAMDAPEGLIDAVANMDVDSALAYTDELFKLTKEEYDDYVKLWEEKQKLAGDHARMFYQSEFDDMKKEFIDKVPPFMDETRDEFMCDGLELMKGLAQGIQNGRSTVINTIIAVVQQAVEAAKEELGIHSPSKVFAQIGDYMAQGLSSGFTNGMKAATSDITAAMQPQMAQSTQNQGLVEGLLNGLSAMQDKAVNMAVQVVLPNGEVLAETVFNDLLNVSKQRGVSLANA